MGGDAAVAFVRGVAPSYTAYAIAPAPLMLCYAIAPAALTLPARAGRTGPASGLLPVVVGGPVLAGACRQRGNPGPALMGACWQRGDCSDAIFFPVR